MKFINVPELKRAEGILDTQERVQEAREALERSTEESYKKLENAKTSSWDQAHRIFVR